MVATNIVLTNFFTLLLLFWLQSENVSYFFWFFSCAFSNWLTQWLMNYISTTEEYIKKRIHSNSHLNGDWDWLHSTFLNWFSPFLERNCHSVLMLLMCLMSVALSLFSLSHFSAFIALSVNHFACLRNYLMPIAIFPFSEIGISALLLTNTNTRQIIPFTDWLWMPVNVCHFNDCHRLSLCLMMSQTLSSNNTGNTS